ncbi:MAG TPA: hypothetical protein VEJ16_17865 [Alphaproteobacteria bacterium]|nr:hypothetical protein [Alphaproteobacteria bacterium]
MNDSRGAREKGSVSVFGGTLPGAGKVGGSVEVRLVTRPGLAGCRAHRALVEYLKSASPSFGWFDLSWVPPRWRSP